MEMITYQNRGVKRRIRLKIKNMVLRFFHLISIIRLKRIVKNSSIKTNEPGSIKILFNMIYGMYGDFIFWIGALIKALHLRGYDVRVLTCGKALTMCTSEYSIQRVHDDKTCNHCINYSNDFFKTVKLPHETYNDYISEEEINDIKKRVVVLSKKECHNYFYKKIDVGTLSKNAAIRYFKGTINPDEELYLQVLRSELINSIIAIDVAQSFINKWKPDVLVTTHLGYSSWGSFAEYMRQKGVRVCSPGKGYKDTVISFDRDDVKSDFKKYLFEVRKNKFLSKDEREELNDFLNKRYKGLEGDTADYNFSEHGMEKSKFDFKKYKKIFVMYPNVAWDSSLLNSNYMFEDVYSWVSFTIDIFMKKPKYLLIIKIHPSELKVMKSENTIMDFIRQKYSHLTSNIKIIPPDTTISPYSLFSFIDKGLVYNGTIGLEMALNNIPVIVAGKAHYGEKGFTFDAKSKEHYRRLIFQNLKLTEEKIEIARIYAYYYFIKTFIPFKYNRSNKKFMIYGWNFDSLNDLMISDDKYLNHICDYIAKGRVYQDW
jgi:hypothetical protein